MNLGNSTSSVNVGNMSALSALVQGETPTGTGWGDVKAMLQMFTLLASAFGPRMVDNAIAPEPVNVPEPVLVVPEPEAMPAPEIVPILVSDPVMAVVDEPVVVAVGEASEMAVDEAAFSDAEPVAVGSESELDFEPLRMPADVEPPIPRKRSREAIWEEKCDDEGMPVDEARVGPKRVAIGNFDTFERKTMNFDDCSDVIKPTKVFDLPPIILMTRMQCEAKIRELERQYKMSLAMQSIRALRNAGANGRSRIRLLRLEIAEIEREMKIAIELEELLDYCETLRKLSASRTVKSSVATEARLFGQE